MNAQELEEFRAKYPKMAAELATLGAFPVNLYRQFERIFSRIEETWGTVAGYDYFEELLMTQRTGRRGFSPDVASELMRLHLLHIQRYPGRYDNPNDPFSMIR